eukprot:m.268567 g.268567  ORF g.268567 m.268567 type:complete len:299 (-) comp79477_c0_seq1:29-925(-)
MDLLANFAVFEDAHDVEVRPGRTVRMLRIEPANPTRVMLFIHGSMASMQQYEHQINHFNDGKTIIVAWDWYGCGDSPKPDVWYPYACDELYLDVRAVYTSVCQVHGLKVVVVGHSMGSLMAVRLAADLQEPKNEKEKASLAGLCLLGGGANLNAAPPIFRLPVWVLDLLQPTLNTKFKELALHPNTLSSNAQHHQRILQRLANSPKANPMNVCKAYYRQLSQPTLAQIHSIRVQTIVIHGESDLLIPPAKAQELTELLGGPNIDIATYKEIKHASHQLMMEQPEEVNLLLSDFRDAVC